MISVAKDKPAFRWPPMTMRPKVEELKRASSDITQSIEAKDAVSASTMAPSAAAPWRRGRSARGTRRSVISHASTAQKPR
ncbi:MAG: hypothetical protein R3D28_09035 [Geminicoccaceae bacterium]